jgi:2-polyprenyl-6-hydroxyphenyl methylase/3-demethylubiquinone-9 3-methyltransferase
LTADVRRAGLTVFDRTGMVYEPLSGTWRLSADTDVNYFLAARKA